MTRTSVPHTAVLDGQRVRVRLPRPSDREALAALVRRTGSEPAAGEMEALLRFDPRTRTVLCVAAWLGRGKVLLGCAGVQREDGAEPDVLVCDEELMPGVTELLLDVLATTTAARERRAA